MERIVATLPKTAQAQIISPSSLGAHSGFAIGTQDGFGFQMQEWEAFGRQVWHYFWDRVRKNTTPVEKSDKFHIILLLLGAVYLFIIISCVFSHASLSSGQTITSWVEWLCFLLQCLVSQRNVPSSYQTHCPAEALTVCRHQSSLIQI